MRILVVDHIFHKKTKSSDFFINILENIATISVEYIDTDKSIIEQLLKLQYNAYDRIIFWQIMPPKKIVPLLPYTKTILVPMYDACCTWTYKKWSIYKKFRFISFCQKLHYVFLDLGIQSFYVKYVPEVISYSENRYDDKTAFIWKRTANLNLSGIINMFMRNGIKKFICHGIPVNKRYYNDDANISYIEGWFDTHEDYLNAVSKCHYFFAPRLYEGIGMGFLEAMGLGLCVVAPNQATMNEYIKNVENGYLFDKLSALTFDSNDFTILSENAITTYNEILKNWVVDKKRIEEFILDNFVLTKGKKYCIKFILNDVKLLYNYRFKYFIKRRLNLLNY